MNNIRDYITEALNSGKGINRNTTLDEFVKILKNLKYRNIKEVNHYGDILETIRMVCSKINRKSYAVENLESEGKIRVVLYNGEGEETDNWSPITVFKVDFSAKNQKIGRSDDSIVSYWGQAPDPHDEEYATIDELIDYISDEE